MLRNTRYRWRSLLSGEALLVLLVIFGTLGCGPKKRERPETATVSGTVTLNGSPMKDGTVVFYTDSYQGMATTDASGRFEVVAGLGANKVFFSKIEGKYKSRIDPIELISMTAEQLKKHDLKQAVPEKLTRLATTTETFDVPKGGSSDAKFSF